MTFIEHFRALVFFLILCIEAPYVFSCTCVFWWDNPYECIAGRTMDWMEDTHPEIWVYPPIPKISNESNSYHYGMLALTAYNDITVDGLNEKGLAGHVLYLGATTYNASCEDSTAIPSKNWLHSILQSYASVAEALDHAPYWRISPSIVSGHDINIHLALEDKTGDNAILEYKEGILHIFRGCGHGVLTNAPFYDEHLSHLGKYTVFGGTEALPHDNHSTDRFVKTTYGLSQIVPSHETSDNSKQIQKLLMDVSVHTHEKKTYYHTLTNISKNTFFFHDLISDNQQTFFMDAVDFKSIPTQGKKLYPLE
ncbi:MAG: linear amide C-N hydrolase [Alphaproteobacteria bacterium]|nr:linear amide C-N hydrolase [Alphaproteobacteria bacterium]